MQIFTLCYNLKFRKLTLYGFTRPQSIRKSKQIPGQTIFFLTVNALMLDLSSRVFVLISRLILGRNSSFQILLNSFALKFPSFITLGSLGTGAAGPQLPRLFCPLWLYQGDRRLCTIEFFLDHNDHHHDHLNFFSGFFRNCINCIYCDDRFFIFKYTPPSYHVQSRLNTLLSYILKEYTGVRMCSA